MFIIIRTLTDHRKRTEVAIFAFSAKGETNRPFISDIETS